MPSRKLCNDVEQANIEGSTLRKKPHSCKVDKYGTVFGSHASHTDRSLARCVRLSRKLFLSVEFPRLCGGYRHSLPLYPVKNCANNPTLPITEHVSVPKRPNWTALIHFAPGGPLS